MRRWLLFKCDVKGGKIKGGKRENFSGSDQPAADNKSLKSCLIHAGGGGGGERANTFSTTLSAVMNSLQGICWAFNFQRENFLQTLLWELVGLKSDKREKFLLLWLSLRGRFDYTSWLSVTLTTLSYWAGLESARVTAFKCWWPFLFLLLLFLIIVVVVVIKKKKNTVKGNKKYFNEGVGKSLVLLTVLNLMNSCCIVSLDELL